MVADDHALVGHLQGALETAGVLGQPLCVALSGGMDSMVLLHALAVLRHSRPFPLSAVHVNHGISPNAAQWSAFCSMQAEQLGVHCHIVTLAPVHISGTGLEQAARAARYAAFAEVAAPVLCLAHHKNDLAETLLLNLFRGAGAHGLAAMPTTRVLAGKQLVRPWLDLSRSQLEDWAKSRNIDWIEDESNQDLHFRRNYLRQAVLPMIESQFSGVVGVLARTAQQMQEHTVLLTRLANLDGLGCSDQQGNLIVSKLATLPQSAVRNVLKHRLGLAGVQIASAKRLETLSKQLTSMRRDAEICVVFGTVACHVWRDRLWLDRSTLAALPVDQLLVPGVSAWPDGSFMCEAVEPWHDLSAWVLKPVGSGQRFQPAGRCRDVVAELLRAQGVPPWVRYRLPALWHGDTLQWVAQLGWGENALQMQPTPVLIWQPKARICL